MINLLVAKSLILFNVFCLQGCAVTVASHPPFNAAMGMSNNALPPSNTRSARIASPALPTTGSSSKPAVALRTSSAVDAAPAPRKTEQHKMGFSDFILNNFTQLLMLCAIGGKCK